MLQWSKIAIRIKRPRNKSRRLPLPSCSCKKSLWKVRMKLLVAVVLVAGLAGIAAWGGEAFAGDEHVGTCVFEKLTGQDYKFCRGDLEVFYPELGDVGCTYIPKCNQYRKRISKDWHNPKIAYPQADKNKKYVLIMVDPDAPNRANPKYRFWRHWVVINIKGTDLRAGKLRGHVLTENTSTVFSYFNLSLRYWEPQPGSCWPVQQGPESEDYGRPTPPSQSGYHRYQFRLYEQPAHEAISLSPEEEASLGSWPLERFIEQFRLGSPVASTQFLTQHHSD
ncbi:phosphatidylethanolamine-binding protein 4 isoform X2 [Mauremys reevesii]|uniref:phosphatidylethanolamine-binding protein 4 isoform X2 n=1 Tax=Mauremys reevesii TaxID=260615 RepID=UPI00193EDE32|nr:phosphatidylethanolamine-binding protein 4 isoform X2 [Mauremys reevesii]